jgi:hypothetical protein
MDVKSDLLKEAIADAKAVKETALANAKIALEEAFAPRLHNMLSTKISEEMEEPMGDEMDVDMDMDMEAPTEEPTVTVDGEKYVKADDEAGEDLDAAAVSDDMDAMGDMHAEGEEAEMDAEPVDVATEDLELEAIIRELEEDLNEEEITEELDEAHCGTGDEPDDKKEKNEGKHEEPKDNDKVEESLNIDEIIEEILSEDELGEAHCGTGDEPKEKDEKEVDEALDSSGIGKGTGMKQADDHTDDPQGSKLVEELDEAYDTIESLRDTINEVNLLNAKLLYTNKLFRNFELSEDQKMKVIENFDRAGNTREVKLVFSTLAENFTVPVKKRKMVKEGIASKPVQSTAPATKTIINEGNQLANRWKKLAGLLD